MYRRTSRGNHRSRRLRMEKLEDRRVLAAVTVSTIADVIDWDQIGGINELINNPGDDNKISLREAIQAANFDDLADTIDFSTNPLDGLNGSTITLNEGITGPTPGKELTITDSVIIDATMLADGITIDAGNGTDNMFGTGDGSRVFSIDTGFGGAVTLAGLTITGGDTSGDGGGILHHGLGFGGSDLTIRDSVIRDNFAQGNGGGFLTRGSETEITIVDSVISGNQAGGKGGGFQVAHPAYSVVLEITRSTIEGNTANGDGGGGFFHVGGGSNNDFSLTDSTIANNTSTQGDGGGLWVCPKTATVTFNVTNSTISGNRALNGGGGGL